MMSNKVTNSQYLVKRSTIPKRTVLINNYLTLKVQKISKRWYDRRPHRHASTSVPVMTQILWDGHDRLKYAKTLHLSRSQNRSGQPHLENTGQQRVWAWKQPPSSDAFASPRMSRRTPRWQWPSGQCFRISWLVLCAFCPFNNDHQICGLREFCQKATKFWPPLGLTLFAQVFLWLQSQWQNM